MTEDTKKETLQDALRRTVKEKDIGREEVPERGERFEKRYIGDSVTTGGSEPVGVKSQHPQRRPKPGGEPEGTSEGATEGTAEGGGDD